MAEKCIFLADALRSGQVLFHKDGIAPDSARGLMLSALAPDRAAT